MNCRVVETKLRPVFGSGPVIVGSSILRAHLFLGLEAVIQSVEDKVRLDRLCAEDDNDQGPFHGSPLKYVRRDNLHYRKSIGLS
jgi:hypothetical protein